MNRIAEALQKKFVNHRIIFWFDEKGEMRENFNEVALEDVEKIEVDNNEFFIKYKILKLSHFSKILLYFPFGSKKQRDNWLLDLELAFDTFRTDQESLFLQEIGLDYHYKELITEHLEFFKNKERRGKLQELLAEGDVIVDIRYKMLAVMLNTVYVNIEAFLQVYATAYADGSDKPERELERYGLKNFFWREVSRKFGYHNDNPSIYDFLLDVFSRNFSLTRRATSAKESRILISLWKDAISYQHSYKVLSKRAAADLNIESLLSTASLDDLVDEDTFEIIDLKIIHELTHMIVQDLIRDDKVLPIVKKRESRFWFDHFENLYRCLEHGAQLLVKVRKASSYTLTSLSDGAQAYAASLYQIDFHYRKFIFYYRASSSNKVLDSLYDKVAKVYTNDWLIDFNDKWFKVIADGNEWPSNSKSAQDRFFKEWVLPYTLKRQRLFVVISDALRYECGWEYFKDVQMEQRYEGEIDYMITNLPSYTQLGMASLLPHEQLTITAKSDDVLADGASTKGTISRTNILSGKSGVRATAINAEDFMKMSSHGEGREFVKANDLIYIYHNRIDKIGDDKTSEDKVFEAVRDELEFLKEVIRKIANMNGNNIVITTDHGFIYQHDELQESDFSAAPFEGTVWKESRRYVIGKNLKSNTSMLALNGAKVGLTSDIDILTPKGINRLRVKGAGSRFVHGGASLQEVIIPVVRVSKKREDTTKKVDIDIIKSTDRITTNILAVSFLQKELVSDKTLPRILRMSLQADDGTILSDLFNHTFNASEGIERQREIRHRFQLSSQASGKYKNQRVKLVLEEPVDGSNKWKTYSEYFYTLNISFTSDFDEF